MPHPPLLISALAGPHRLVEAPAGRGTGRAGRRWGYSAAVAAAERTLLAMRLRPTGVMPRWRAMSFCVRSPSKWG